MTCLRWSQKPNMIIQIWSVILLFIEVEQMPHGQMLLRQMSSLKMITES